MFKSIKRHLKKATEPKEQKSNKWDLFLALTSNEQETYLKVAFKAFRLLPKSQKQAQVDKMSQKIEGLPDDEQQAVAQHVISVVGRLSDHSRKQLLNDEQLHPLIEHLQSLIDE